MEVESSYYHSSDLILIPTLPTLYSGEAVENCALNIKTS